MSTHAAGTFEIESWEEEPYEEREGAKLTRTRLRKTFRGDIEGESTAELRGLRGEARITNEPAAGHSFTLDYDLE